MIENGFLKVGSTAIDVEMLGTQAELLYMLWIAGPSATGEQISEAIEIVCAYKGWDIGLND